MSELALNQYWEIVINTIRDGLLIVDKQGVIVSVNNALEKITGQSRDELIGKTCEALNCDICKTARAKGENGKYWCILFKTGNVHTRKCVLERTDGTLCHALKNASLLRDENGVVIGAVETITDISELVEKENQIEAFKRELRMGDGFHGLIGISASMLRIFDLITNAASSDAPVIIYGESGTGKELVCKAIHQISARRNKALVKVNCAALTESLLESELFGHVKGAYTGAHKDREGRFETAHDGTIFLDEIGDLPYSTQVKLLRVLEEKTVERVGDNTSIPVDVRIITATNRDLQRLVERGQFREDFYFRINVIPIHLPPLRHRKEDIPLLAKSFYRKIQLKTQKPIKGIDNDTMQILMDYHWPGNIRELKSAFEYAFVTCQEDFIMPYHLPPNILQKETSDLVVAAGLSQKMALQKEQLIMALEQAQGNQSKAAEILGISRVTVWNRMKKFGIAYKLNKA